MTVISYMMLYCLQIKLDDKKRSDILIELREPQNLRACLDVVEIVIAFLSSSGGDANKQLKEYLNKSLKIKDNRFISKKVCVSIHLLNILVFLSDHELHNQIWKI